MDPSIVFVPDTLAFNAYLSTVPERVNISVDSLNHFISLHFKDGKILTKYRNRPFPYYEKLRAILRCFETTSLGLPTQLEALYPPVACHSATIQVPNQLPQFILSNSFIHSDSTTSSAVTTGTTYHTAWSPSSRKVSESNQHWAYDNQPASSLSIHSSSAPPTQQQSGPHLPAPPFDASESQQGAVSARVPDDVSAFRFLSARASCKRRHVDDEMAIFSMQPACPAVTPIEQSASDTSSGSYAKRRRIAVNSSVGSQSPCMTPVEAVEKILDSIEVLRKIIQHPPPPPSALQYCMWAVAKSTEALSRNSFLSIEQKVRLRQHFCRNPLEAASLPEDNTLLDTIFRNMIQRPDLL